ncbi:MAG: dihydrofolate reductase family protein [bacterium]
MALPESLSLTYHETEPYPRRIPLEDVYTHIEFPVGRTDRPFVYLNMVQTLDGQAVLNGTAYAIGTDVDHYLFRQLRFHADAVLSGAGTLRKDDFIVTTHPQLQERRRQRGQSPNPLAVVVTSTCKFGPAVFKKKFFTRTNFEKVIVTTRRARPKDIEKVKRAGVDVAVVRADRGGEVYIPSLLRWLSERGVQRLLCEGGPTLNVALARHGAIDELFLTTALRLGGDPDEPRIFAEPVTDRALSLISEFRFEHEGQVKEWYLRFRFPEQE